MDFIFNIIIITIILLLLILTFYYVFKKEFVDVDDAYVEDEFTLDYLVNGIKDSFNHILNTNPSEFNLNKLETQKLEKRRLKLRKALRTCNYGDVGAKEYIKEYIKDLLQLNFHVNEENIDKVIPFQNYNKLSIQDKFEILLFCYKKEYGMGALDILIQTYHFDELKLDERKSEELKSDELKSNEEKSEELKSETNQCYEITAEQIEEAYNSEIGTLDYSDKLEVLVQRIYQRYKGHGVIDAIRDMSIDGVSAGVSGLSNTYYHYTEEMFSDAYFELPKAFDSIWIFYHGKTIYLSFLGFGSQRELERVCKNIYRYDNPGQLSAAKGYIANEMKDGSRVIVIRPPLTENWAFFVRKFDSIMNSSINTLIMDEGYEIPIEVIKWLIKGCQVIGITGEQGCGKTTLLKSMIEYINPSYTLRVQELIFELNLRKIYPTRNILSFKETSTVSGQESLDLQKKTDGAVTILGEVATAPVARWLVQLSQVASKFTMFTHHAKTTENLISSLRNALLQEGGFHNESIAEEQVVDTVNFDIHMVKSVDGHRYIERITEIIPYEEKTFATNIVEDNIQEYFKHNTRKHMFYTKDIVVFQDGKYILNNCLSERTIKSIRYNLTKDELIQFNNFFME